MSLHLFWLGVEVVGLLLILWALEGVITGWRWLCRRRRRRAMSKFLQRHRWPEYGETVVSVRTGRFKR